MECFSVPGSCCLPRYAMQQPFSRSTILTLTLQNKPSALDAFGQHLFICWLFENIDSSLAKCWFWQTLQQGFAAINNHLTNPWMSVSAEGVSDHPHHCQHFVPCDAFLFHPNLKMGRYTQYKEQKLSYKNSWVLGQNSHEYYVSLIKSLPMPQFPSL